MNESINVNDICKARDIRIERLKDISYRKPDGLILFTLNIPGDIKDSLLYRKIFSQGIQAIRAAFNRAGIIYNIEFVFELKTGPEAYFTLSSSDLHEIKVMTVYIEEVHPLGRIFDIDVFDTDLNQIKSQRSIRKCYICSRPGFECARSRRHSPDEVLGKIKTIAEEHFKSFFWQIASIATRAMISEVLVTPKPGLIDRANSGSHSDMDIFTFIDSSIALTRVFYRMAELGGNFSGTKLSDLLNPLRKIGIEGEKDMYKATRGVNTQKGLVFSIGILSAAAGYILCTSKEVFTINRLCRTGGKIAADIIRKDFRRQKKQDGYKKTNGERLYIKYGIKGARGEAEGGFKSELRALENLKLYILKRLDFNRALAGTLIYIMTEAEDTNILGRGSFDTLNYVKTTALSFVADEGIFSRDWEKRLVKIDRDFMRNNISPGGSADMLAVTIFLYFLEKEFTLG